MSQTVSSWILTNGGDVDVDAAVGADEDVVADADEVVDCRAGAHDDVVADDDVAGDHHVVGEHAVVADAASCPMWALTIKQVVASRPARDPPPFSVPVWMVTASRNTLPSPISSVVGSPCTSGPAGAPITLLGKKTLSAADGRVADDRDVGEQPAAGADRDVRADDAERPDLHVGRSSALGVYDG